MMKIRIRADSVEVEGYVNAVGRDSRMLKDDYGYPFVEQIEPGVFARALDNAKRRERAIQILLDHDQNHIIGDTDSNLMLEEDNIGLYARATITDPETIKAAREKRLRGWSFGFNELNYKESYTESCSRRSITELELIEVSVIDDRMIPCYTGTSIKARAEDNDSTIYVRAMENDKIEYEDESCTGATSEEQPPETGAPVPENEPGQQATKRAEEKDNIRDVPDLSIYRNKIKLLRTKGGN